MAYRLPRAFDSGSADFQPVSGTPLAVEGQPQIVGRTDQLATSLPVRHEVLTPGELWALVGGSRCTFQKYQSLGMFRHLEVTRPVGLRKYSRRLIEEWLRGRSTVRFGKGARS